MPLRNRFWLLSVGLVTGALFLPLLVLATVVTPPVAERLVRLDEEKRLVMLASHKWRMDLPEGVSVVETSRVRDGDIAVALNDTQSLVSNRPLSVWEAAKVVRPSPVRGVLGLLLWVGLLYVLASVLARSVSRPVKELAGAVGDLSKGKRDVRVAVPREEELAELARAFNEMAERLARREQELEQALEAKERMFASTSHELRTPLTVILGYCQMLEDGLKGELTGRQRAGLEVIHRNARGLLQQVETLLTNSRLRAGTLPLELERVDLRELVHEVVEELEPMAREKGLRLDIFVEEAEVPVEVDFQQGRQIVQNLVVNALKFTAEGGVKVGVSAEGVRVEDTGPGVSVAFEERLFQEFSRGPNSEGIEGTGLGLALSQRLARRMGGEIKLLESSDRGAVFCWSQPLFES